MGGARQHEACQQRGAPARMCVNKPEEGVPAGVNFPTGVDVHSQPADGPHSRPEHNRRDNRQVRDTDHATEHQAMGDPRAVRHHHAVWPP